MSAQAATSGARGSGGALDRRLLRRASSTRVFLGLTVAIGLAAAAATIGQAWVIAQVVERIFVHHRPASAVTGLLGVLLAIVLVRTLLAAAVETTSARAAANVKSQLRGALLARAAKDAARPGAGRETASVTVLATRGIDALDAYFSLYLPQVVLAVLVPPLIVVAVAFDDWLSAAILLVTVPLVPAFMALIGLVTGERMQRQLLALQQLGGQFLDVVAGLPTLRVFGRARAQERSIATVSGAYRERALASLRLSFLSSLVLELVATLAVAIIAVAIALRLMEGGITLGAGLFALILAPEAYLPLRRLGANYHASAEGVAAANAALDVIESPAPAPGSLAAPSPADSTVSLAAVTVRYPDSAGPALERFSLELAPGESVALVGPTGCGKSTVLRLLLGLLAPDAGKVSVGGVALADIDPDAWHARITWVPQEPHLIRASLAENIRLTRPQASLEEVHEAIERAALGDVLARLPQGLETMLGEGGAGLSAGERQRLALARAFIAPRELLLLDEPTASLDGATEDRVLTAVAELARGRTAVFVAHSPALAAIAGRIVTVGAARSER